MTRLRISTFFRTALLLAGAAGLSAVTACNDGPWSWRLVWEDEFAGDAGLPPDAAKWRYDVGEDWGNAQLEYDTDRTENAALDGAGHLVLTARKETFNGRNYTSARLITRGLFDQARGRFEARMKLPRGRGLWPAFWLLGSNFENVGWPACGEIDIMEYRGQEPDVVHGSLHGPGYSGGSAITRSFDSGGPGFDADFHVFAVEWDSDRITWFVDGRIYQVVTPKDLPVGARWVFQGPAFLIVNLAVGGAYVGAPDASTTFPQTLVVDWVRVYRGER